MGTVYKAVQLSVGREVAVKVLHPELLASPRSGDTTIERFRREAQATSRLSHPNTLRLIDFGQTGEGILFLVLELLKGRTLGRLIKDEGPLSPTRVALLGRQICRSLSEAHSYGIIHRDLKPDNVCKSWLLGSGSPPGGLWSKWKRVGTGTQEAMLVSPGFDTDHCDEELDLSVSWTNSHLTNDINFNVDIRSDDHPVWGPIIGTTTTAPVNSSKTAHSTPAWGGLKGVQLRLRVKATCSSCSTTWIGVDTIKLKEF